MSVSNIVDSDWLAGRLNQADVAVVDCRFNLKDPDAGKKAYDKEHLPGAVYMDLEKDLSGPVGKHGGRHPLPSLEGFSLMVGNAGISKEKTVVIYDDQAGAMASRLWWMLTYAGHPRAYVLKDSFSEWKRKGYDTTSEVPEPDPVTFIPEVHPSMLVNAGDLKGKLNHVLLIDSRNKERYEGRSEPIDPVAGHIPGAVQENWEERTDERGVWKRADQHAKDLKKYIETGKELVVYCGSGVTACVNVLALTEAGAKPRLYAGSWSDWISYEGAPVARAEKNAKK
ncbi:sulfurtransferase [Salipaludibacillus aurantiacus]|uniref:Thiosulfate/3-mercaptopyruvate sulfurtransferase n=1 Tax=Salipaludibacillus aurantiacus TaxID=1601833 RepID=A0A1H9WGI0_9BACI|nr:sulfurtransferase [Salipaludibacillus aurantiacus]SES32787.1 thiosulfate/3-mercaptopyruvate sulfurtransferase [Salipaludibacillus aurantiacus]